MLDKEKDIDAVTISTPDHVHGPAAVFAMQRGKHVYVQKPMTHNIREARILTEMAREQKWLLKWEIKGDQIHYSIWYKIGLIVMP